MPDGVNHNLTIDANGRQVNLNCASNELLSDTLRHRLGLSGVHVGCEHGVCGACTIYLDGTLVRSCLLLAVQVDGSSIETVESLADGGRTHPLQDIFESCGAFQCGFCTPGYLLSVLELASRVEELPDRRELRRELSGNLCRCTGYASIIDAAEQFIDVAIRARSGGAAPASQDGARSEVNP